VAPSLNGVASEVDGGHSRSSSSPRFRLRAAPSPLNGRPFIQGAYTAIRKRVLGEPRKVTSSGNVIGCARRWPPGSETRWPAGPSRNSSAGPHPRQTLHPGFLYRWGLQWRQPNQKRHRGEGKIISVEVKFARHSPLEGDGFELPVPRVMQARLKAKITAGFGCMPPSIICGCRWWPSAQAQSEISKPNPYRARNRKFESISLQQGVGQTFGDSRTPSGQVEVRIHSPPAESLQTFGSSPAATATLAHALSNCCLTTVASADVVGYPAGPGWDAHTGLGGVNGQALQAALASPQAASPAVA